MLVDGRLYLLHVAISPHWKIHYFSADMADSPAHRAEDAAFLEDMPRVLGPKALAALHHIQSILGLDYGGIYFGLGPTGDLLLFEANATMAVIPTPWDLRRRRESNQWDAAPPADSLRSFVNLPDKDPRWDYRRAPVERIYRAVWQMLAERSKAAPTLLSDLPGAARVPTQVAIIKTRIRKARSLSGWGRGTQANPFGMNILDTSPLE
jgi:hypothetical protein